MIYKLLDKFIMNDFTEEIINNLENKKKNLIIFDVGCFVGNFSRNIKKKLNRKKTNFYLFDPNPSLKIPDFNYIKIAFTSKSKYQNYYLNDFFPSSGSSLKPIVKKDKIWNFSRKIASFNMGKDFKTYKVKTDTIDNFCKYKKIKYIDILKIDVEGGELDVLLGAKKILKKTNLIQLEVLDTKKNFNKKYRKVINILNRYDFKVLNAKNIFSVGILSNIKSMDILLKKNHDKKS